MTGVIVYYISQFYPLIIGVAVFMALKSLKMLKHKTRISLESRLAEPCAHHYTGMSDADAYNIRDLYPGIDKNHADFILPHGTSMVNFGSYITSSSEPRKAAYAALVSDSLIINGKATGKAAKRTLENGAYSIGAEKFGIIDLNHMPEKPIKIPGNEQLVLFAPEKEKFLSCILSPRKPSGLLLRHAVNYNIVIAR